MTCSNNIKLKLIVELSCYACSIIIITTFTKKLIISVYVFGLMWVAIFTRLLGYNIWIATIGF